MKLINIKCPNCAASLEVAQTGKITKCIYCNTSIMLDDEIIKIHVVTAGQIDTEQEYINAETNLNKFKDYEQALKGYKSLSSRYVDSSDVWVGLLRSSSHDFKNELYDEVYEEYWNKFCAVAPAEEILKYQNQYDEFMDIFHKEKERINKKNESKKTNEFYLTFFLGWLGIHRFKNKETAMGIIYLCTLGLFGIGWLIDCKKLTKNSPKLSRIMDIALAILIIIIGVGTTIEQISIASLLLIAMGIILLPPLKRKILLINKGNMLWLGILIFWTLTAFALPKEIPAYYGNWINGDDYVEIDNKVCRIKIGEELIECSIASENRGNNTSIVTLTKDDKNKYDFLYIQDDNKKEILFCVTVDNTCQKYFEAKNKKTAYKYLLEGR